MKVGIGMDMVTGHLQSLVSHYQLELGLCRGVLEAVARCSTIEEVKSVLSAYEQVLRGSLGIDVSQQGTGVQNER